MKGLIILLWALIASVRALAPRLPTETDTPPCQACLRMPHRPAPPATKSSSSLASPTPTTPPKPPSHDLENAAPPCTSSALADLFTDVFQDNPRFCTIYEQGWTITITTDCKGCALETMTMPKRHCKNTSNVTFRIPSTRIECSASTGTVNVGDIYPAGFKGPSRSVVTPS